MKCEHCCEKMVKILDLKKDEILKYIKDSPLRSLEELKGNEPVLVYFRKMEFFNKTSGNKIQFRKIENVRKKELKLSGFKTCFSFENPTVIYGKNLLYTLIPMKKEYLDVIIDGIEKLGENYTGTKLNNILKKSFMLKEFMEKYDNNVEVQEIENNIKPYEGIEFPF